MYSVKDEYSDFEFWWSETKKRTMRKSKYHIDIDEVDINKIVLYDKVSCVKKSFKYYKTLMIKLIHCVQCCRKWMDMLNTSIRLNICYF